MGQNALKILGLQIMSNYLIGKQILKLLVFYLVMEIRLKAEGIFLGKLKEETGSLALRIGCQKRKP